MVFVLSFISSLSLVLLTIPFILKLAVRKQLFGARGDRAKLHAGQVPQLGGVAIYLAVLIALLLIGIDINEIKWLLLSSLIVFGIGVTDDLKGVSPGLKLLFQITAAFLIVVEGGIRIASFQGILDVTTLAYLPGVSISLLFVVGLVNAFNLIDGIDGLAGSVALMVCLIYAFLFFQAGHLAMAYLSCSTAGAMLGFLFFNVCSHRKIFMGDCGSLLIGLLISFYSIKILNITEDIAVVSTFKLGSKFGFVVALLSIPLFDTLRVFVLRILNKRSPFKADYNHIHHRLLSLGLSHIQATILLISMNLGVIAFSLRVQLLSNLQIIILVFIIMISFNCVLSLWLYKRKNKTWAYLYSQGTFLKHFRKM